LKISKLKSGALFIRFLQWAAISVFLGRAWQHLYWDAPFRALLWDEVWLSGIVTRFTSMTWETYITSMEVDQNIAFSIKIFGVLYLISALIALFINYLPRILHHLLILGALGLIFLAFLYCKERFFSIGQFFEYALQFGSPLFLWWWKGTETATSTQSAGSSFSNSPLNQKMQQANEMVLTSKIPNKFLLILKIAISLTFTCHGLYAVGYYPIPVSFMEMTMNILGVGEDTTKVFLKMAGILDFAVAIGIFLPWKWARIFLIYAIIWGFGTTIARIWAYFDWEWLDYVLLQWLHESVMRMPHFLIPLAVLVAGFGNHFTTTDVKDKTI